MNLQNLLTIAFDNCGYSIHNNTKGITKDSLLKFIAGNNSVRRGGLGYTSAGGVNSFLKKVFTDKVCNRSYLHFLLSKIDLKICAHCSKIFNISHFHKNKTKVDGLSQYCKDCDRDAQRSVAPAREARRRASKLSATPLWSEIEEIRLFYKSCPEGYQVDHIVPLQSDIVCGLHVISNLQYLTAEENLKKSNRLIDR